MELKVLVVDNSPVLLRAVSAILIQEGCEVKSAGTGLEALEVVDDFQPDIVITDLIMPMVSGEQLCRILRNTKKHEDIFLVVLSAIVVEDRERILQEVPCDLCIAKGNLQEIRTHLREVLQVYTVRSSLPSTSIGKAARIPEGLQPIEMTSELLSEKHHFLGILDNLDEGIIEINHEGKVVSVNSAALHTLSQREENIVGMSLVEAVDWGSFTELVDEWTSTQLVGQGMDKLEILEDAPFQVDQRVVTATFVPIAESGSVFGLCILRDISRQFKAEKHNKELDNALRLVKKMDAMSCMAGGFAHDFNNLLTVICGNLDIVNLQDNKLSDNGRSKLINEARKAAIVAVDLTRQISCFSNFGIVSRENIEFEKLVQQTVQNFFNNTDYSFALEMVGKGGLVSADPEELAMAIVNVLQNGVEASAEKKIDIVIGEDDFDSPQLMSGQYVPAGKYIRLDICDSGGGISSEQLFRVFDPYYSTKERGSLKGMGLGLTVVYAILRNHGGYVVVTSGAETGTTVSMYLPAIRLGEDISSHAGVGDIEERSVLLIEPETQMGEIGRIMLGYIGFSVTVVHNRAAALEEITKVVEDNSMPKPLVILALSDKKGETSVETCRRIHEIDPELKVVAMSGTILDPIMENCREYGFVSTLPKPFSMDSLKHVISTVLQS